QTCRPPRRATDEVRARPQPQDRQNPWLHLSSGDPLPGRRGDPMTALMLIVMLALRIFLAPLAATAQQPAHLPTVGWSDEGNWTDKARLYATFLEGLRALGYVEGQHLVIARRDAEGHLDRLPGLAAELVRLPVDVIVTT